MTQQYYAQNYEKKCKAAQIRAVPEINLWGVDGNVFLAVPPSGFMPVAVGLPSGTVMLTNPPSSGNTLTQFFNTHFLYIGPKVVPLLSH